MKLEYPEGLLDQVVRIKYLTASGVLHEVVGILDRVYGGEVLAIDHEGSGNPHAYAMIHQLDVRELYKTNAPNMAPRTAITEERIA